MDEKTNPFDKINPISNNYLKFKEIINNTKDRNKLIKINKMIKKRLQELEQNEMK